MTPPLDDGPDADRVATVGRWIRHAEAVSVLTGAGISTSAGIPDYRGPNGVWTKNPAAMRMVSIDDYLADPQVRVEAWQERLHHPAWTAEPSAGHRALVELERSGKRFALVTQNIDGLHQAAGSDADLTFELHGTIHLARCLECGYETPMQEQLDRVRAGEADPPCQRCGGIQRSATIAFGQQLDLQVLRHAMGAANQADVFVAVGTSLTVQPAAHLCTVAVEAGARLVVINAEPTPFDDLAHAVFRDPIDDILPLLVAETLRPEPRT